MTISRRGFMWAAGAAAVGAAASLQAAPRGHAALKNGGQGTVNASGKRPNVILVLCDDLGWGDLGEFWQNRRAADVPKIATPHMDAMMRSGAMLTEAFTTAPVCAPARASMVSGKHQGHCNLRDNSFDATVDPRFTIGTVMRAAGYATWHLGKWGIGGKFDPRRNGRTSMPCAAGFDYDYGYPAHVHGHTYYHSEAPDWETGEGVRSPIVESVSKEVHASSALMKRYGTLSESSAATPRFEADAAGTPGLYYRRQVSNREVQFCFDTDLFTAKMKQLIDNHLNAGDTAPFFCYACYTTVHGSRDPILDTAVKDRANFHVPGHAYPAADASDKRWGGGVTWQKNAAGALTSVQATAATANTWIDPTAKKHGASASQQRYITSVQRLDAALADLTRFLKLRGLYENTLFVFTSDNGPAGELLTPARLAWVEHGLDSNGPYKGMKRWSYDGGLREPTFAVWPGHIVPDGNAPKRVDTPFQFPAWMATLADAAGLPQPAHCDGVSLLPALTGQGKQLPMRIYTEYVDGGSGQGFGFEQTVRDGDYVLVRNSGNGGKGKRKIKAKNKAPKEAFVCGVPELYNTKTDIAQQKNLANDPAYAQRVKAMEVMLTGCRVPAGLQGAATGYAEAFTSGGDGRKAADALPMRASLEKGSARWNVRVYTRGADTWPWVPNFRTLAVDAAFAPAKAAGIRSALEKVDATAFGAECTGWLNVPETGTVNITTRGSGGVHIWLHDAHVADFEADSKRTDTAIELKLAAGWHPVRIAVTTQTGLAGLPAIALGSLRVL